MAFSQTRYTVSCILLSADIANLIIHEQAHSTVFVKNNSDFNEEFATFTGDEGTRKWLVSRYGEASKELFDFEEAKKDAADFLGYLLKLKAELNAVYESGLSKEETLIQKERIINSFIETYKNIWAPKFRTEAYRKYTDLPLNNAYLSLYDLYNRDLPLFTQYYEECCNSDLKLFIKTVKDIADRGENIKDIMRLTLASLQ